MFEVVYLGNLGLSCCFVAGCVDRPNWKIRPQGPERLRFLRGYQNCPNGLKQDTNGYDRVSLEKGKKTARW